MFRGICETCFTVMQHIGSNMSKLIRCNCECCNKITYVNTCSGIHEIYNRLSSREFTQTSSDEVLYNAQQLNEYVRTKERSYFTGY